MDNVNKTLYIPLYGKAYVSKLNIILKDKKAEEIWEKVQFPLKTKSKNKYLAYYMGMRSAIYDSWVKEKMKENKDAVILHLGCGLDSRILRIHNTTHLWYDIDFPSVIEEKKKYFEENFIYHMLSANITDSSYLKKIENNKTAIVIMEGVSMYLTQEELISVFSDLQKHFNKVDLLMDCYSSFAAKASKYKNPIQDVGVNKVYGMDDPNLLCKNTSYSFVKEHNMTPDCYIKEIPLSEQKLFRKLYAGKFAKSLYHMYEFTSKGV